MNYTEMTKAQLIAEAATQGVALPRKANRDTIIGLLVGHVDDELEAPAEPEAPATLEAAVEAMVAATPAPATGTGLKIEKDRDEQNGIKRPSIGGKCRAIWDALDAHAESTGDDPTAKDVKALAAEQGWNPNNASIEFYQWRKFNGVNSKPKV